MSQMPEWPLAYKGRMTPGRFPAEPSIVGDSMISLHFAELYIYRGNSKILILILWEKSQVRIEPVVFVLIDHPSVINPAKTYISTAINICILMFCCFKKQDLISCNMYESVFIV